MIGDKDKNNKRSYIVHIDYNHSIVLYRSTFECNVTKGALCHVVPYRAVWYARLPRRTITTLIPWIKVHGQRKYHWSTRRPSLLTRMAVCISHCALFMHLCLIATVESQIYTRNTIHPMKHERRYQMCFIVGWLTLLIHLEDRQYEDFRIRLVKGRLIPPADHLEELGGQIRAGIELNIAGEHKVGGRGFARYVSTHVHWI